MYTERAMNIVVATLVADFLRAEIEYGREKIPKLKIEMQKIRRAIINFTARSMTVTLSTAHDIAHWMEEDEKYDAIEKEIEFIEENVATRATLMVAIQHDNINHLIEMMACI